MKNIIYRAKYIYQHEGPAVLLRQIALFISQHVFQYGHHYLYEHTMAERDENDFIPKIKDFTLHKVTSAEQADELLGQGYDMYALSINTRKRLARGAVAFCIFIGKELAHIGWLALTEEAMRSFEPFPYRVNFSEKEACTGGTFTTPKYEGNGLMKYGYFKRFQFLAEHGILRSRNAVNVKNVASQKVHAKFNPRRYAEARYLKILWWQSWKEKEYNIK